MHENYYKTSDLALATTLSLFFPIQTTEHLEGNKVVFVFEKSQEVEQVINQYWNGDVRVEPKQYFNQLKVIKTRIYNQI